MEIKSIAIPFPIDNIDTDQIIPARFLKQVDKKGYGKNLFYNWRYHEDGSPKEDFELNKPCRQGARIIIAGNNFGCGSSREHAAWSIADYGIKVVVSSKFADIFKGNAYNNGILPIELETSHIEELMEKVTTHPDAQVEVNLTAQTISLSSIDFKEPFEISSFKKQCLMDRVDETQYLINLRDGIAAFEAQMV